MTKLYLFSIGKIIFLYFCIQIALPDPSVLAGPRKQFFSMIYEDWYNFIRIQWIGMVERKKAGNHGISYNIWDNFHTNPLRDGEILLTGETTWISTYCKTLQNVKYVLKSSDNVSLVFFCPFWGYWGSYSHSESTERITIDEPTGHFLKYPDSSFRCKKTARLCSSKIRHKSQNLAISLHHCNLLKDSTLILDLLQSWTCVYQYTHMYLSTVHILLSIISWLMTC